MGKGLPEIVGWIQSRVREAGADGVVFGLSGGIDSAVVAGLAVRACGPGAQGLILPCESDPKDIEDALLVAKTFRLRTREYDLTPVYRQFLTVFADLPPNKLAQANLKARLRSNALYYVANEANLLVLGTSNLSEITVGYFTKWGDSAVDLRPLADLTKTQVRRLARELGVPERIIAKAPSAGLWPGQTDEAELGLTYEQIDAYIAGEPLPTEVAERIATLEAKNRHKRIFPPSPGRES